MHTSRLILTAVCALAVAIPSLAAAEGPVPYPLNQLQVTITDNRDVVMPGEHVTYLVVVRNPEATAVTADIVATLPSGLHFEKSRLATLIGKEVHWNRTVLAKGKPVSFIFNAYVDPRLQAGYPLQVTVRVGNSIAYDRTATATPQRVYADDNRHVVDIAAPVYQYEAVNEQPYGAGILTIRKISDKPDANAGEMVSYTITVRNGYAQDLRNVSVNDSFNPAVLRISDAGSGDMWDGRITWRIGSLQSGESRTFVYTGLLSQNLRSGNQVLNTARVYVDGNDVGYIPTSSSVVNIHGSSDYLLPQTGIEDFFGPIENTSTFLSPIAAAAEGTGIPLMAWLGMMLTGVAGGGLLGKKFIA